MRLTRDVGRQKMKTRTAVLLLLIAASARAGTNDFASLSNAWSHVRSVYKQHQFLSNWEPEAFDKMQTSTADVGGHTFVVMHFEMAQNGSLYIVERLKDSTFRIVGQCHGASIAFRKEGTSIVARVHHHVSASEGTDTDISYSNGVFGAFEMKSIRPEFYR